MQRSSQIVTTDKPNTQRFKGRMPFLSPNQQRRSTEGKLRLTVCPAICRMSYIIIPDYSVILTGGKVVMDVHDFLMFLSLSQWIACKVGLSSALLHYCVYNSVKNQQILVIFGTQSPEETRHQKNTNVPTLHTNCCRCAKTVIFQLYSTADFSRTATFSIVSVVSIIVRL